MEVAWAGTITASETTSVREALAAVDAGAAGAAIVVDRFNRLVGLVSDGDCRRYLLGGGSLDDHLEPILNRQPLVARQGEGRAAVLDLMQAYGIGVLPIVDYHRTLVGVHLFREIIGKRPRGNLCVLLAGGRGTRLGDLTKSIPKPMVRVAGRPILERLILHFMGFGISRFTISVGHLGEVIEAYFGDGSQFGCSVSYVQDPEGIDLGTAGPLSLLRSEFSYSGLPLIVANGDLITQVDVGALLDHHHNASATATLGVYTYRHQVPFGVVTTNSQGLVTAIEEKPDHHWQVSAGVNVLDASLIKTLPHGVPILMTDLLRNLVIQGERVTTFEVDEDWVDVGTPGDLNRAQGR